MSNDPTNELPQRSGTFRAVVQVGTTVTSYLRAGAGRPVVMLAPPHADDASTNTLLNTLRESFRMVVPEVPATEPPSMEWLAEFLDGLGLQEVGVIVHASLAPALLHFAPHAGHRIARIVVLTSDSDPRLSQHAGTQPLLLVADHPGWLAEVAWFLSGAPERLDAAGG